MEIFLIQIVIFVLIYVSLRCNKKDLLELEKSCEMSGNPNREELLEKIDNEKKIHKSYNSSLVIYFILVSVVMFISNIVRCV